MYDLHRHADTILTSSHQKVHKYSLRRNDNFSHVSVDASQNATAKMIKKRPKVNKHEINAMVIRSHHVENEGPEITGAADNSFEETGTYGSELRMRISRDEPHMHTFGG